MRIHDDAPASSTEQVSRIDPDRILLPAFDDFLIESRGRNWRKICNTPFHVVSVPIGRKVIPLLCSSLEGDSA